MPPSEFKQIVLQSRPEGDIEPNTFRAETIPFSDLKVSDGQALIQVTWMSLDPAMRGWIRDVRSYVPPVQIGEVMRSQGLGNILSVGNGSKFKVGQLVRGNFGWREYAVMKDADLEEIVVPKGAQPLDFINTLGSSGMTAYFGLKDVGELKAGETILISGAAGSVGSAACQMAKQMGAKVYAIAGSDDKCEWLKKECGVDTAFNYKSPTFKQEFKKMPYLDVYFDNVGGEILDMALTRLNKGARVALCGAISGYNGNIYPLKNYLTLIGQRAKIQGFIVFDYASQYGEAAKVIGKWLEDGSLKRQFHVVEGLESAPTALPMLFSGGNTGKLVVKVAREEAKL